jgi:hypothetical protein
MQLQTGPGNKPDNSRNNYGIRRLKKPMSNYTKGKDGYHKKDKSKQRGGSPFDKPIPPVRDGEYGLPYLGDGTERIDWERAEREAAERLERRNR